MFETLTDRSVPYTHIEPDMRGTAQRAARTAYLLHYVSTEYLRISMYYVFLFSLSKIYYYI